MIAKKFRFHGYGSLKFVYSHGKTARAQFLSLKYATNPRRQDSRLAVVVSKKISKKAPERNRIRRRLYEAARLTWPVLTPGTDMVITVFDSRVGTMPSGELVRLVNQLFAQTKSENSKSQNSN